MVVSPFEDYFPRIIYIVADGCYNPCRLCSKEMAVELGDASATIERYREGLKHILLMLVGMAEMGFGRPLSAVLGEAAVAPRPGRAGRTAKNKPSPALCLPRHLYRTILLPLRPAESAARRLIIATAQGIVVTLPPFRPRKLKPRISDTVAAMRRLGLAINLSKQDFARYEAERKAAERRAARPRGLNLSLLDALKYPFRIRRKYVPAHAAPRVRWLDDDAPRIPLPQPPSRDDPISAAKLTLRLEALASALDDLPGQAQRFARWKARNDAALQRDRQARDAAISSGKPGPVRFRRFSALRRGRPPGGRLPRFDPDAPRRKNIREVDEILAHANAMALYALEQPRADTS